MHIQKIAPIACLLALTGCASMSGGRMSMPGRSRTIASANGTALPTETGPPGKSVTAELEAPEPRDRAAGRISGRVVDEDGQPVASVEVRLADGGSRSGRVIRDVTDASGGFTLSGLREGEAYTVIAEADDGERTLVGRSRAEAPNSLVKIRLRDPETARAEPDRVVGRASTTREPRDEVAEDEEALPEPNTKSSRASRVNLADLPPAEPAENLDLPAPKTKTKTSVIAWKPDSARTDAAVETVQAPSDPPASPAAHESPKSHSAIPEAVPVKEEEANPLPVAKERPLEPQEEPKPAPSESSPPPTDLVSPSEAKAPEPKPEVAPVAAPAVEPPASPPSIDSAAISPAVAPRTKPTWRDLTEQQAAPAQMASTIPISTRRLPTTPGESSASKSRLRGLFGAKDQGEASAETALAIAPSLCQFDTKKQRVVDFRLPDLDGKPMKLSEIDSDYILLDFWGTWCKPCQESIPKLVDLQTRYGSKTLRVVGIAAEESSKSAAEQARSVDEVARKLGINYTLLMSSLDGKPCPLQQALHVQAYPTMILLDRTGKILWRGTGAEPVTLARLDRVIASRADSGSGVVRR